MGRMKELSEEQDQQKDCPECGNDVEYVANDGTYYCSNCDQTFKHLCDECGTPYNGEMTICPDCFDEKVSSPKT